MGFSVFGRWDCVRGSMGQLCLGNLLELGPERDMVSYYMVSLCGISACEGNQRLEGQKSRLSFHSGVFGGCIPLLGCEFRFAGTSRIRINELSKKVSTPTVSTYPLFAWGLYNGSIYR